MGTTRIKVIDLSSDKKEVKTSRKRARLASPTFGVTSLAKQAEKLTSAAQIKEEIKVKKGSKRTEEKQIQPAISDDIVKAEAMQDQNQRESASDETAKTEESPDSTPIIETQKSKDPRKSPTTHHKSKKYQEANQKIEKDKNYPVNEAIELLYQVSMTKFDPTVEAHLNVVDKSVRGTVNYPHAIVQKKEKKFLIFSDKRSTIDDLPAGRQGKHILWGDEKTINQIENGELKPGRNFDQVYATSSFMPKIAKLAKILGPKGMMPNPKNGTLVDNIDKIFDNKPQGMEYKTDPTAPIVHTKIGKLSFKPGQLEDNLRMLVKSVGQNKIRKIVIKTTMSPGVKVTMTQPTASQS